MKLPNSAALQAKTKLVELGKLKLPVRSSVQVVKLEKKLDEMIGEFIKVRDGLFGKYEVSQKVVGNQISLITKNPEGQDKFNEELTELLNMETEVVFEKIRLPEKIAATCDACKHNMDKLLELEPDVLRPLVIHNLVEVV